MRPLQSAAGAYTTLAAAFNNEERIELVKANREFVGSEWLEYLNAMGIHYHIRIRENFKVVRQGHGS